MFPVYAGVILIPHDLGAIILGVPRVCGGDPLSNSFSMSHNPCSPCMRGWSYRVYDSLGKPKVDYDLTNHGAPKYHPIVPHAHDWLAIKSDGVVKYERKKEWRELNQNEKNNIERWLKSHERK